MSIASGENAVSAPSSTMSRADTFRSVGDWTAWAPAGQGTPGVAVVGPASISGIELSAFTDETSDRANRDGALRSYDMVAFFLRAMAAGWSFPPDRGR